MQITKSRSSRVEKELDKEIPKVLKKKAQIKPYLVLWRAKGTEIKSLRDWTKRGKYETLEEAEFAMEQFKMAYSSSFQFCIEYKP